MNLYNRIINTIGNKSNFLYDTNNATMLFEFIFQMTEYRA